MKRPSSLKRPLVVFPLLFHFATLLITIALLLAVALRVDSGGAYTDEKMIAVVARAIVRHGDGRLAVRMTPELAALRAETPDLWFAAEDDAGRSVSFGLIPRHYQSLIGGLSDLSYAQMRDREPPYDLVAVIRQQDSPAGRLTILGHGKVTELSFIFLMASNVTFLPIFILLALTSLIVTPWIVRRSLAGISRIALEAEEIDADRRGRRLSEQHVPSEIAPLVRAVNDALRRLDEGYERQRRFIASAAHELRTPIAILRAKVEAAPDTATRRLGYDVQRLATLAEQLLDLQRLDTERPQEVVDMVALVRSVVADMAPLLIASDRGIEVRVEDGRPCRGNAMALERVVTNLVQNAMEHGGRNITVRVAEFGFEVEDDGPGIPPGERERVFEPFHRLRPRSTGSGLGLNLVQQVVDRHGGRIAIHGAHGGGTIVRVELPPAELRA